MRVLISSISFLFAFVMVALVSGCSDEQEQVDAASLEQRLSLLAEGSASLLHGHRAPRLDAHAQRTDRAADEQRGSGDRLAREGRAAHVDDLDLVLGAVRRQMGVVRR